VLGEREAPPHVHELALICFMPLPCSVRRQAELSTFGYRCRRPRGGRQERVHSPVLGRRRKLRLGAVQCEGVVGTARVLETDSCVEEKSGLESCNATTFCATTIADC
jgi:hypothetical protein